MDWKIRGSVIKRGRIYAAGDEDALAKVLPEADVKRLLDGGVLVSAGREKPKATPVEPDPGSEPEAAEELVSTDDVVVVELEPAKPKRKTKSKAAGKTKSTSRRSK